MHTLKNIFYNSFYIKILFLISLIIILEPPLNNYTDLFLFILCIFLILFCKIRQTRNILILLFVISLSIIIKFTDKNNIVEYHSTFFSLNDIVSISKFLPNKISTIIQNHYVQKFDIERALKSYDSKKFTDENTFNRSNFIEKPFAFSSDNFFHHSNSTRLVNSINFKKREDLRIGQINTLNYNLVFDKELRRSLPFYILYKIPENFKNSKICGSGNIYYYFSNNNSESLTNLQFYEKSDNECITLDREFVNIYLLGFSISSDDELELRLYKNTQLNIIFTLLLIAKFFFILFFYKYFFELKMIDNREYIIFFLSLISSLLFIILKDVNLLTGLRYFRGGADGLFHEFQAYEIVRNLSNFKFIEAAKGGESIFYFMPGLRYFIASNKILFGETNYGYLIIGLIMPFYIFKFFKNIFSKNISFYLVISFMFFPIFENMGFGHFNYIGQIARNHAETLSIFLIIYCLYKITESEFHLKNSQISIFFITFLLAFSAFCRPNFLPTTSIIFLYLVIKLIYLNKSLLIAAIIGYFAIFLSMFHNLYFGNEFILFTKSSSHFIFESNFEIINSINVDTKFLMNQFLKWNPLYNIHRLVILFFVIYGIYKFKNISIINYLFVCMILQHFVLLITHPDSRYAYLAWLLTFILFIYFIEKVYLYKFKKSRNSI